MKKNPSTEEVKNPSPLGAFICYVWEISVALYLYQANSLPLIALWLGLDVSIGRVLLLIGEIIRLMLIEGSFWYNNSYLFILATIFIWSYLLKRRRGLCYPVIPKLWCCKNGEKLWVWHLIREP